MEFRIADTFTDSLGRLTGDEQKAAKMTAFDLQLDPKSPGMQFHRLDRTKDRNFWSVRVNRDLRLIVHRTDESLLLCYVGHHDKAYEWAERRKLEVHPRTGAAQLVEVRETIKEIVVPVYIAAAEPQPLTRPAAAESVPVLASISDEELLGFGVPAEWLGDVRAARGDALLAVAEHLPSEAAEAVLELATGGRPSKPQPSTTSSGPFEHPDAQRRFRTMANAEELRAALDSPWDRWTVFLHPEQRAWIQREFAGPARVAGSAGTGKTVVALHRAVHLARGNPDARVLLTTFSDTLASALRTQLRRLLSSEPRLGERIDVYSLQGLGLRLHRALGCTGQLASREIVEELLLTSAAAEPGLKASLRFLLGEWEHIIDAWQLGSWEAYRDVPRLGRKTRLPESQRRAAWSVFERVQMGLKSRGLLTEAALFTTLSDGVRRAGKVLFEFAVVDEAQDLGVAHLRFFAALGGDRRNALFFSGDLGQRIFQQPFSWRSLGVDVRGRSKTLRVNYRTSHQIRAQADRLLGGSMADVDGNVEDRRGTVSVFNGPSPVVRTFSAEQEEVSAVGTWLRECSQAQFAPHEMGVFVRSEEQVERAKAALGNAGLIARVLDDRVETAAGQVSICTMHRAKGLEFRAVAVMACDDEVLPLQRRIESVGDTGDLEDVYETERHLLYVACTRARDRLLVTGVEPASEFLGDFAGTSAAPASRSSE